AAVPADGSEPPVVPAETPHVQKDRAVGQLHRLRFVTHGTDDAAECPGPPSVVAEDDVRLAGPPAGRLAVAWDQEAAALQLDTNPRTGGVPRPARHLDV